MINTTLSEYQSDFNIIKKIHIGTRSGDIRHSLASVERAQRELGFETSIDISKGLRNTIEWYIEKLN